LGILIVTFEKTFNRFMKKFRIFSPYTFLLDKLRIFQ